MSLSLVDKPAFHDLSWVYKAKPEERLPRSTYLVCKRLLDLTLLLLSMPAWLPLVGVIALLIKIESPGASVIFLQRRTGKGGFRFPMYKFRTMVPNAEELKAQLAHLNELKWPDFKISDDPRITRIGKYLRKSSLDELPQIFNVLRGDMSLVGPRPTSFAPETYTLWHTERLEVIPGITGLWQVVGRGSTQFDDRLKLDIAYIQHRCMSLDIAILMRTFTVLLERRGAY